MATWDQLMRCNTESISTRETACPSIPLPSCWPEDKRVENQKIDRMLVTDVIEPVQTELASPNVFVPKKDGALRICVN